MALGIVDNPWLAWQLDRAVHLFGATVMGRWHERDKQGRRVWASIEHCMGLTPEVKPVNIGQLLARGGVDYR